jgi:hypothetical protein
MDTDGEVPMIGLTTYELKKRRENISPLRLMEASGEARFLRIFDFAISIKSDEDSTSFMLVGNEASSHLFRSCSIWS